MLPSCHNAQPDLLTLQADLTPPGDRFSIQLHCGAIVLPVVSGWVKLGLTGLRFGVTAPGDLAPEDLVNPLKHQWPELQSQIHSPTDWDVFSLTSEGLRGTALFDWAAPLLADVTLQITVNTADLRIVESEGIWHPDIHPNIHGVIDRILVNSLCTQLTLPLSQLTGKSLTEKTIDGDRLPSEALGFPDALNPLLDRLMQGSSDLDRLLQEGNLDRLQGLQGGQFMAADFRNMDLSGANLERSNFRGADLSDGDFTEANLSYARLSGADLSGALLSNANLQGANLHRASLALANLSGADLREADLTGANLSNVNFGGAEVRGLKWGNNEGIAPDLEAYLRSSGAVFSE